MECFRPPLFMMHRQIQCYFQLLAVLTQPVSEGALDGYTEANHKIEIHYSKHKRHTLSRVVPLTHAHTRQVDIEKLTSWLLTQMITQLVVIKEVDI